MRPALLRFHEAYFERLWGGTLLHDELHKSTPENKPIGEAWLIADHASQVSTVSSGPWAGRSLHDIMREETGYLLGTEAKPTIHGQFPLLLKILDAADVLSVQVHPDDTAALALGEPDVGKTEMWHVLSSREGSELICGLHPDVTPDSFAAAIENGTVQQLMRSFPAPPGTSTFVSAGTVHAIGAGILLAEIQQNSDLTYRIYDWDRRDSAGNARELHLEKALKVTDFDSHHGGPASPLAYDENGVTVQVLGACPYFATQLINRPGGWTRKTHGRSFHLLLARDEAATVSAGGERETLARGEVLLVPAGVPEYRVDSGGAVLAFFVPNVALDIIGPLREGGNEDSAIRTLGVTVDEQSLARG